MTIEELLKNTDPENEKDFKFLGQAFTNGGPFALMPEQFFKEWSGTYDFLEFKKGVKKLYEDTDDFMDPKKTHYGIVCKDPDEDFGQASIEVKDGPINVFHMFSYIECVNVFKDNDTFIFRLGFGLDELEEANLKKTKKVTLFEGEPMKFEDYVIFDAAVTEFELVTDMEIVEIVKIKIPAGNYSIHKISDEDHDIHFVIFEKLQS